MKNPASTQQQKPQSRVKIVSIDGKPPKKFFEQWTENMEKQAQKEKQVFTVEMNKKKLFRHAKDVCWPNIQKEMKICKRCPLLPIVKKILKEESWD